MIRSVLLCAVALLLTGCWTSSPWYAASDSRPVIPDGRYRLVTGEMTGQGNILSIRRRPDGAMAIEGGDNPLIAILIPLASPSDHRYIVQLQREDRIAGKALFMLLDNSNERYRLALLPCIAPWSQRAEASGGLISRDPQSAPTCTFATRKALSASLVDVSKVAKFDLELIANSK